MREGAFSRWFRLLVVAAFGLACGTPPSPQAALSTSSGSAPAGALDPLDRPAPFTSEVKKGTLANGLTFYVRRHEKPVARAALWLAIDAGSVLEDDDQRGLAHFVEHMAFNGTTRFPKHEIASLIERAGMTMGPDANASTSFDQTIYQFTVPTDDETVMLQGLDVLRDIAGNVSFEPEEVERERPVILEEWRRSRGARARLRDKELPVLLQGSRYAERLTIGLPEVIERAPVAVLRRFYADWYRPESMAVVAVGDFDSARVEAEIERRFSDLRRSPKGRKRDRFDVPRSLPRSVVVTSDPELRSSTIEVFDKVPPLRQETKRDFRNVLVERLYVSILSVRLAELRDDPARPFVSTRVERRHVTRTLDALTYTISAKQGRTEEAITLLFQEIERARRHGFLLSETMRAEKNMVARYETSLGEADNAPLATVASELVRNFFERESVPGAELELDWVHELLPGITLAELGEMAEARSSDQGRVVSVSLPNGVPLPSTERVAELLDAARHADVPAWKDTKFEEPLLAAVPTRGSVVAETHDAAADATVWTLSNGVRVVVKPTAFRRASVVLRGFQSGGTSLCSDDEFVHARFADEIMDHSGAGKFSEYALRRILAGSTATVSIRLEELGEWVEGQARSADLQTLLELVHLRLTRPRVHKNAFEAWKGGRLDGARHRADSPEQAFADEIGILSSSGHLRRRPPTVEAIEAVDMNRALTEFQRRVSDLGGFTFVIVGNVEPSALKPLVETYLGSLPSKSRHEAWKDPKIPVPTGKLEKTISLGSEPKSRVGLVFLAPTPWTLDASRDASILQAVLELRLFESLRERLGGTYSISVSARFEREPTERRRLAVSFGCAPENVEKLTRAVFDELRAVAREGVEEEMLARLRLRFRRQREVDLMDNGWWAGSLLSAYRHADDFRMSTDIEAAILRVTRDNVRATAARMVDEKNYVLVTLRPAPATKPAPAAERPPGG